jgi:hypothetical protein
MGARRWRLYDRQEMRAPVGLTIAALALSACHALEPEGHQQTSSFTTFLTPQQTRARAEDWLGSRALYVVTSSDTTFVRAEKLRPRSTGPGEQIDAISVRYAEVPEGTEVEVQAITYEVAGSGNRNRADQVSPEAIHDADELARVLMLRP